MIRKSASGLLVAVSILGSAASAGAVTLTIDIQSIGDINTPPPAGGFLYGGAGSGPAAAGSNGSPLAGAFGFLVAPIGTAQSGLSPVFSDIQSALLNFNYFFTAPSGSLGVVLKEYTGGGVFVADLLLQNLNSGGTGAQIFNFDVTGLLGAGNRYSLGFQSLAGSNFGFNGVTLEITPVPEPADAISFCGLIVVVGALWLRRKQEAA